MADLEAKTVKKTLIFCFDGTCNDPKDAQNYATNVSITNILKLHVLFGGNTRDKFKSLIDDSLCQRSFYYRGVGTHGNRFTKFINTAFAPERGDVRRILNAAIKDLQKHYHEGSRVLVFGFSRGAALARRFAAVAQKRSGKAGLKINFIGVFDTVAAISSFSRGIGFAPRIKTNPTLTEVLEYPTMNKDIQKVVHLVALDENRVAFQPTLFGYDSDRVTEVWFPGTHSDVGGGYWIDGLSDLALKYMIEKVKQECGEYVRILDLDEIDYDQLIGENGEGIKKDDISIKALVNGFLHEHKQKIIARKLLPRCVITAGDSPDGIHPPVVHESIQLRHKEIPKYSPPALRDVKYIVTPGDDKIRHGVTELGVE